MSGLAGWVGDTTADGSVLERMAEAMTLAAPDTPADLLPWHEPPATRIQTHLEPGFAVAVTQPAAAADVRRIASSADSQVAVAFAGYLYTEDDGPRTQPAAHCLQEYLRLGPAFAEQLNGSLAVVIHDRRSGELHLVMPRLATRPIYTCSHGPLLFATEIKAILTYPGVSREVDADAMLQFLARRRVLPRATYYEHIRRAPEASVTTWNGREMRSVRYWQPPARSAICHDARENARRTYRVLQGAIRRACAGAERPMMMLSGGMDSRAVATACDAPLPCVTMHAHPGREVQTARRVARALGDEHRFVRLPPPFPLGLVTHGSLISDGTQAFYHAQGLYLADALAEHRADLLLTGFGLEAWLSDSHLPRREWCILGRKCRLPSLRPRQDLDAGGDAWVGWVAADAPLLARLAGRERVEASVRAADERVADWLSELDGLPADRYLLSAFIQLSDLGTERSYLNMLALERIVPARTVTFDTEMIDLFLTIPPEQRAGRRLYRHLFAEVDRRTRWIPCSNTGVPLLWPFLLEYLAVCGRAGIERGLYALAERMVPSRAWRFDRTGWPRIPIVMRNSPEWHRYLRRLADGSRLVGMGILDPDGLRRVVEEQIGGRGRYWTLLGSWITLEEWLAHYGP